MGSLKALQEWCRIQCENYNDVEIKNMSTSFRDGLAFCAIIHKHRPDLIDFDSLSKDNVYENNRLAFVTAESELGIPALLDPEDMVSMKVPDRLSVITYVSQYYNFFTNKSHANPPCMKRPSGTGQNEPATKRPVTAPDDRVGESELAAHVQMGAGSQLKRSTLSSICAACQKHVHLVQRILIDGKLYHRSCFRCRECCSTLLPGSYKAGSETGSLVCTHHFAKWSSASRNGRPDLSRGTGLVEKVGGGPSPPENPPTLRDQETAPQLGIAGELPADEEAERNGSREEEDVGRECSDNEGREAKLPPAAPPNPFADSEEEEEEEADATKAAKASASEGRPSTPNSHLGGADRPVPAPRRIFDPSPPPRPLPRVRPSKVTHSPTVNGDPAHPRGSIPRPRERSHSPGSSSLSSETPKPKDPPWLALVQSEPKKKPAPPPPPAMSLRSGSVPSLGSEGSRPSTPPHSSNPFEDDDDDDDGDGDDNEEEEEAESVGSLALPSVVASHPWYRIAPAADAGSPDPAASAASPASSASPTHTFSPGSPKSRKRPAPKVPPPHSGVLPHSQPSSASPSPALSAESLSSSSDHGSSKSPPGDRLADQDHHFTKSISEPSISGPGQSSANHKPYLSPSPSPPPPPVNTSSAPATPQTIRSAGTNAVRPPPPRPPSTPSPLAKGASPTLPPPPPPPHSKRTCKENPFNRKASPSYTSPTTRPPKGPRPARPPAPGHGFPLIKRKVQSDQYIPVEDIHVEMGELEKQLDELEQKGVVLEKRLRDCQNDEEEETMLVDWFTLIHEKHMLVRREAELVYTAKQQNLEERQADVEYELRCLLNKPEKEWSEEDKRREQELMAELVTVIEQRNHIINSMDQDRQREEEEDKLLAAMIKRKEFHKEADTEQKKKGGKFKPMKVLKMLGQKNEGGKSKSPRKDKS